MFVYSIRIDLKFQYVQSQKPICIQLIEFQNNNKIGNENECWSKWKEKKKESIKKSRYTLLNTIATTKEKRAAQRWLININTFFYLFYSLKPEVSIIFSLLFILTGKKNRNVNKC